VRQQNTVQWSLKRWWTVTLHCILTILGKILVRRRWTQGFTEQTLYDTRVLLPLSCFTSWENRNSMCVCLSLHARCTKAEMYSKDLLFSKLETRDPHSVCPLTRNNTKNKEQEKMKESVFLTRDDRGVYPTSEILPRLRSCMTNSWDDKWPPAVTVTFPTENDKMHREVAFMTLLLPLQWERNDGSLTGVTLLQTKIERLSWWITHEDTTLFQKQMMETITAIWVRPTSGYFRSQESLYCFVTQSKIDQWSEGVQQSMMDCNFETEGSWSSEKIKCSELFICPKRATCSVCSSLKIAGGSSVWCPSPLGKRSKWQKAGYTFEVRSVLMEGEMMSERDWQTLEMRKTRRQEIQKDKQRRDEEENKNSMTRT
jgi:hypothetical protein